MILPELAAIPQASQYFSAESKLGARLHHSNIVNLVDRGSGFIVLEYVESIDLERLLGAHRKLWPEWTAPARTGPLFTDLIELSAEDSTSIREALRNMDMPAVAERREVADL